MEQLEVIGTQYGRIACLRVVSAVCARIITIVSEAITSVVAVSSYDRCALKTFWVPFRHFLDLIKLV